MYNKAMQFTDIHCIYQKQGEKNSTKCCHLALLQYGNIPVYPKKKKNYLKGLITQGLGEMLEVKAEAQRQRRTPGKSEKER